MTRSIVTRHLAHNRPGKPLKGVKAIVIHWTANEDKGADAAANRNYFNTTTRSASCHYIVDSKEIIECIPNTEIAWHCGDTPKKQDLPLRAMFPDNPNNWTIGIEMCVNKDGHFPTTYDNTVWLVQELLKTWDVPVIRHYDVSGKDCPRMFLDALNWEKFVYDCHTPAQIIEKIVYKEVDKNYTVSELFRILAKKIFNV